MTGVVDGGQVLGNMIAGQNFRLQGPAATDKHFNAARSSEERIVFLEIFNTITKKPLHGLMRACSKLKTQRAEGDL